MKKVIEFKISIKHGCGTHVTDSAMERVCSLIKNIFEEYIEKIELYHLDRVYITDECFAKVTFKKKLDYDVENDIIDDLRHLMYCVIKADLPHEHHKLYHHVVKVTDENEHIRLYEFIQDKENVDLINDEYLITRSFTLLSGHYVSVSSFYYKNKQE